MSVIKPYYLNQNGWTSDDYYGLHRYLHSFFDKIQYVPSLFRHIKQSYDVSDINLALFKHGQQTLGE